MKIIPFSILKKARGLADNQFVGFPVWLEINPRYHDDYPHTRLIEAAVFTDIDGYIWHGEIDGEEYPIDDDEAEVSLGTRNFKYTSYGISWRMWYAEGAQIPSEEERETVPWKRFKWDTDD